jgi:hypothetical protein
LSFRVLRKSSSELELVYWLRGLWKACVGFISIVNVFPGLVLMFLPIALASGVVRIDSGGCEGPESGAPNMAVIVLGSFALLDMGLLAMEFAGVAREVGGVSFVIYRVVALLYCCEVTTMAMVLFEGLLLLSGTGCM